MSRSAFAGARRCQLNPSGFHWALRLRLTEPRSTNSKLTLAEPRAVNSKLTHYLVFSHR